MPQAVDEIPQPTDEPVIGDSLLEQIWDELRREYRVAKDLDFQYLTYIVPPQTSMVRGIYRNTGMRACFEVQSPSPNKGGKPIRTFGMTPWTQYQEALREWGHFVSGGNHPAKTIFRNLTLAHLQTIGALEGLDPVTVESYYKNLDTARWVVEKAQGDRYEEGITMQ